MQPAIYFGIYDFPEAAQKFAYSRLLQVADYPPRGPYTPWDINHAQEGLKHFLQQSGYFEAEVRPRIDLPVDARIVDALTRKFSDFRSAYTEGGLSVSEFDSFAPTRRTLRQFITACHDLDALVRDIMLPNPD